MSSYLDQVESLEKEAQKIRSNDPEWTYLKTQVSTLFHFDALLSLLSIMHHSIVCNAFVLHSNWHQANVKRILLMSSNSFFSRL